MNGSPPLPPPESQPGLVQRVEENHGTKLAVGLTVLVGLTAGVTLKDVVKEVVQQVKENSEEDSQ